MRENPHHSFAARQVTRVLILSYFVALALGLIDGAKLPQLATPFVDEWLANYLMAALVLALTAMILIGILRRPAALLLALMLFWASYLTMYSAGDLAGFWRDLALIGGLLISADVGQRWIVSSSDSDDAVLTADSVTPSATDPGPDTVQVPLRRVTITRLREDLSLARDS